MVYVIGRRFMDNPNLRLIEQQHSILGLSSGVTSSKPRNINTRNKGYHESQSVAVTP